MTPKEVVQAIVDSDLPFDQCIKEYDRWTHVSIPNTPAATPRRQTFSIG
jgi:hypothetical protein